jgi:hypothetical protein
LSWTLRISILDTGLTPEQIEPLFRDAGSLDESLDSITVDAGKQRGLALVASSLAEEPDEVGTLDGREPEIVLKR